MSMKGALVTLDQHKSQLIKGTPQTLRAAMTYDGIRESVALSFVENPNLGKCTVESVYASVLYLVRLGLEIGGHAQQCWILPYGTKCVPQVGVQGKIELAVRSGKVKRILCGVFHANDIFDYDLATGFCTHKEDLRNSDRGPALAAWCRIWLTTAEEPVLEVMREADFQTIFDEVKRKNGGRVSPSYRLYPDEMRKRSAVSRALKRVPRSRDLMQVLSDAWRLDQGASVSVKGDVIDAADFEEPKALPEHIEDPPPAKEKEKERVPVQTESEDPSNEGDLP